MTKTVVGSFDSYREAQQVVQELQRAGIAQGDVNIVASNVRGEYRSNESTGLEGSGGIGSGTATAAGAAAGTYSTGSSAGTGYEPAGSRGIGSTGALGSTGEMGTGLGATSGLGYTTGTTGSGTSGAMTSGTAADASAVGDNDAGYTSASSRTADLSTTDDADTNTSGAATGAVTGGVIGGVAGLALAFTSLTIPVFGPIIAAGPIVATLTGAGVGAVAGGLIGGLTDLGVHEEHAKYYAESVRRGGALVTVRADDDRTDEVTRIMQQHGAIDINKRAETWRSSGWQDFDNTAKPYSVDDLERERSVSTRTTTPRSSSDWSSYSDEFRADFDREYGGRGARYEDYEPAYRWGFENADSYRGRDWTSAESDLRRDWERTNPGSDWERFKSAVQRGWDRMASGVERAVGTDDDRTVTRGTRL